MWPTSTRLEETTSKFPYTVETNPYRAKRYWPPDFSQLPPKYQFRLERRFRRRTKLSWARPRFMAWTKIAQWVLPLGIVGYTVLYLDPKGKSDEPGPFDGIRRAYQSMADSLFNNTSHLPPRGKHIDNGARDIQPVAKG